MEVAVRGLSVLADIGVNAEEIGRRQKLVLDVTLVIDPPLTDEIGATVDYREIVRMAEGLCERRIALIETFATSLVKTLSHDPRVRRTTVTVAKPGALANGLASVTASAGRPS